MKKIAVFPGSFDPITVGHESIIQRALPLFDEIIIGIGVNPLKKYLFTLENRIKWIKEVIKKEEKIKVMKYEGLTIDFCRENNAKYILRGIRNTRDFDFEKTIAEMNKLQYPEIETVLLISLDKYASISSSIVRNIFQNGGRIEQFIPKGVLLKYGKTIK